MSSRRAAFARKLAADIVRGRPGAALAGYRALESRFANFQRSFSPFHGTKRKEFPCRPAHLGVLAGELAQCAEKHSTPGAQRIVVTIGISSLQITPATTATWAPIKARRPASRAILFLGQFLSARQRGAFKSHRGGRSRPAPSRRQTRANIESYIYAEKP